MIDLAAACDMFCVENTKHLWPHCHGSVEGVEVDEIKICRLDADLLPSRFEELFGLGALLRGAVEGSCGFASARVVDGVGWGADNFVALDGQPHLFQRESACDEALPTNCSLECLLCELVHVYVQLLLKGEEAVRNVLILVPSDIFELHGNGKGLYEFLDDAYEVCMRLPLLQISFWVVAVADDSLAVRPCPHLRLFIRGIDLLFDVRVREDFLDYCQESNRP